MVRMEAVTFALLTAFFFGLAPVLEKTGLRNVDPLPGLVIRTGVVFGLLLLTVLVMGKGGQVLAADRNTVLYLGLGGMAGALIGHLLYYYALKAGEASEVVPVVSIYPLVAVALAVIFLGEDITTRKIAGALLIVAGVVLIK